MMKKKVLAVLMAFVLVAAALSAAALQPALAQEAGSAEEQPASFPVLTAIVQDMDLAPLEDDASWKGGYYHSTMTEDGILVIVSCCAANEDAADGTGQAFREAFAATVSGSAAADYQDSQNQELTARLTHPVYDVTFTTGGNEDTCLWKMILLQTDTHTYAYAFRMDAEYADELEEAYRNAVSSLELRDASAMDDDPSARGESLEDFVVFFDAWYQYGDLNAESIRISGDGTWEYRNALNDDGTGGYIYDDGRFVTSGTTVLQLYSQDGSHVADVSLDENGDLMLTPLTERFGSVYADAAYIREEESVAYEAQPVGE
ncbi:MAG: hypothetical protein ACI4ML_08430 [Aristaeellaceae bacterium]